MQTVVILVAIALTRFYPNKRSLVQGGFAIVPLLGAALLQVFPFEDKWSLAGALWLCEYMPVRPRGRALTTQRPATTP